MLRGYMRPEPRDSAASQKAALIKAGVAERHIYEEDDRKRGDSYPWRESLIVDLRGKSEMVVPALHNLAANTLDLRATIADILGRGHIIVEARTGRRSDDPAQLAEMVFDAVDFRARKGLTTRTAKRMGTKGGANSPATKRKKGLMPIEQARAIWRDPRFTVEEKLERINADDSYEPYTLSMAYRRLKRTGAPSGPRMKPKR